MSEKAIEILAPSSLQVPATAEIRVQAPKTSLASRLQRFAVAARILTVRLRFIVVFAVASLIVGRWDLLRNYWDKLTQPTSYLDTTSHAVSLDTEYFCPMDPGVVSDWSGKCGVCNMTLVRRKKGDMVHLPEGIVARMQFSPHRVQLAGIQTSPVSYRPLVREITAVGRVTSVEQPAPSASNAVVMAQVFERDIALLAEGLPAEVICEALLVAPCEGRVGSIDVLQDVRSGILLTPIELDSAPRGLRVGMPATVRIKVPIASIEPFCSMPRVAPPISPESLREVFVCLEHPEVLKTTPGKCPLGNNELERRALGGNQRVDWWCPMHPKVTSDSAGAECRECNGMKLMPRVVSFTPAGEVLAVPDSAVIDTGARKVVYVEQSVGMFDGKEVQLGPRCGDFFPVIKGLEAGQRVATSGSFLIDAETRLNPGAAVSYFGAASAASQ